MKKIWHLIGKEYRRLARWWLAWWGLLLLDSLLRLSGLGIRSPGVLGETARTLETFLPWFQLAFVGFLIARLCDEDTATHDPSWSRSLPFTWWQILASKLLLLLGGILLPAYALDLCYWLTQSLGNSTGIATLQWWADRLRLVMPLLVIAALSGNVGRFCGGLIIAVVMAIAVFIGTTWFWTEMGLSHRFRFWHLSDDPGRKAIAILTLTLGCLIILAYQFKSRRTRWSAAALTGVAMLTFTAWRLAPHFLLEQPESVIQIPGKVDVIAGPPVVDTNSSNVTGNGQVSHPLIATAALQRVSPSLGYAVHSEDIAITLTGTSSLISSARTGLWHVHSQSPFRSQALEPLLGDVTLLEQRIPHHGYLGPIPSQALESQPTPECQIRGTCQVAALEPSLWGEIPLDRGAAMKHGSFRVLVEDVDSEENGHVTLLLREPVLRYVDRIRSRYRESIYGRRPTVVLLQRARGIGIILGQVEPNSPPFDNGRVFRNRRQRFSLYGMSGQNSLSLAFVDFEVKRFQEEVPLETPSFRLTTMETLADEVKRLTMKAVSEGDLATILRLGYVSKPWPEDVREGLVDAVTDLALETDKAAILSHVTPYFDLLALIESQGWLPEAHEAILSEALAHPESLSLTWIQHLASIEDPRAANAAMARLAQGPWNRQVVEALREGFPNRFAHQMERSWALAKLPYSGWPTSDLRKRILPAAVLAGMPDALTTAAQWLPEDRLHLEENLRPEQP